MISPETEGAEVAPNEINLGGNDFETSPLVFNAIDLPRTRRYTPCYLLLAVSLISTAIWRIGSETAEVSKLTALDLHNACGRKLSWSADRHLCVAAKGAYNGAEVTTQPCGSLGFQDEWIFTKRGKNITRMRLATAPHLCMSPMSGPKIFPGSKLLLQWCSDTDHHQHFSEVNGTIRWQKRANLCMDVQYDKDAANTPLQLWHCTGAKVQMFDQWPCKDRCFRQIHFTRHPGMCLTTAGWHLKEGVDLGLSPCLESHWGASQFKFSTSGGKLQLALNHELCAEADGSGLRIAKCAENHPKQDFMLNYSLIVGRGSDPSCIMAKPSKALKLAKSCRSEPEVEALTSGCEEIIHPHIKVSDDDATGCPRQIRWSSYPSLCIGTMAWHVGHGQNIVLSACEDHKMAGPRQHWVFTTKGKIQLASSPSYCLEVTKQLYESYFPISSQADGAHLQLSQCIDGDEAQQFTMGPDNIIRQGDKCVDVEWRIPLPYSRLVLTECGGEQQFYRDVCKNEEHAVPPHRKGSFIVVGDWGWDHLVHGNVPKATCQEAIGARMAQMMDELGDVKFIINVGDSFYPDGLTSKSDPRWDIQWRERYPGVFRSVPWYSVYGNHDTHHDPGWCHSGVGSQINGNLHDYGTFYMPHYSWHIEHDDLNVEVLGLDLNKFVDGWNATRPVSELELSDCQYSPCPDECRENAELRAEEAFNLMSTRLNKSQKSNLLVFSHYPTDYLQSVPDFVNQLRPHGKRTIAYFSGHRHNTDQTTTLRTGPHDWLVGGGGGWSCDGIEQGFVVGIIDNDFQLKTHPVLVNPWMCCPDLPKENNIKLLKRMKRLRLKLK